MKEEFEYWNPSSKSIELVDLANSIIEDYELEGYTLTLRQLYYQFVAKDLIPNTERSYKNLGNVITKGRIAGLIDWDAIEDRNRQFCTHWWRTSVRRIINQLPQYIRHNPWLSQGFYVEVWVEKEALGNVVAKACDDYLVPYMSCKGYLSASEAYRAGKRFKEKEYEGKRGVMIHLGDHDPSGVDMTRDNTERLEMFARSHDIEVRRIALNMNQVKELNLPPNPAKITDSRAKEYIKRYGQLSWELDALEPSYLEEIIRDTYQEYIDWDSWHDCIAREKEKKGLLRDVGIYWDDIQNLINSKKGV